jgi:uncharacterized membrane-anchored protein YitT (DUF2179 family)
MIQQFLSSFCFECIERVVRFFALILGAFIAAFAIDIFFIPNNLIDGGTVGIAMLAGRIFGTSLIPYLLFLFNLPFLILAFFRISKKFVLKLTLASLFFALFLILFPHIGFVPFHGDNLEVVVIGGAILGVGVGMIIRYGGCLDGTEILGIIFSKRWGCTVGQVVFFCNIFIFGSAGFVFGGWHPPLLSLIAYLVVGKVMDIVIVGLDETKSLLVISTKSKEISDFMTHELGIGLTVMYGRGGFSGQPTEILYIITERLQLAKVKELVFHIDPKAFVAIQNLHEVAAGKGAQKTYLHAHKEKLKHIAHGGHSEPT